jgi:FAD dependent oxidoreductase TIGR03364
MRRMQKYDLVVVGAGIVGLGHALAAARRGKKVAVIERDAVANGASVRNFGFVTVNGQEPGETRNRTLRSREVWAEVADAAGIPVLQRGSVFVAQRPEAMAVLQDYVASDMGEGCELWSGEQAMQHLTGLRGSICGALSSPRELRVEARGASAAIARYLQERYDARFTWQTAGLTVEDGRVRHSEGTLEAEAIVIAPGTSVAEFAPEYARQVNLRQCTLQMMRIADPGFRLPSVVMSDLSLLRYGGMACQPSTAKLRARLEAECAAEIREGVHLIVAQSADGSLVIGDSHRYAAQALPFAARELDELILGELRTLFGIDGVQPVERWLGHYAVADVKPVLRHALGPRTRLVSVTNGLGMSTAFALGEETIAELFD